MTDLPPPPNLDPKDDPVNIVLEEIAEALDPGGQQRQQMKAMAAFGSLLGTHGKELRRIASESERLQRTFARAHVALVPRGWGVTNLPVPSLAEACAFLESGDGDAADQLLAELWDEQRSNRVARRAGAIGSADPELKQIGFHRRRLLKKAAAHHAVGAYEASVPIVLAQAEGIVTDVSEGKLFFSKSPKRADVVDPGRLASIASGLEALRAVFSANAGTTETSGRLSRHGILHGRELGYDTEIQSAKCWSLLDVVVEWAQPAGRELAEAKRRTRLDAHAGSNAVDGDGARVDRREFSETRTVLGLLCTSQMPRHAQYGRFRDDLVPAVYSTASLVKRGLPEDHGVRTATAADGQIFTAWRRTITGWVLGSGIQHTGDGRFLEWRYGGPSEPMNQPPGGGWAEHHPDWP
ncbi:hypothetical protein [Isoptericola sp. NPDC057191]|uniref:hypothetical protein n=1 Tax=Isoptericola sp. NPDC057191 TaxID=3346041 RepID=UPI00363C7479